MSFFFHFQYGVSEEDDIRMKWVWNIVSFLHIHAFLVKIYSTIGIAEQR